MRACTLPGRTHTPQAPRAVLQLPRPARPHVRSTPHARTFIVARTRTPRCLCTLPLCITQDIKFNVHAHPTLSEVLDELFKAAHVDGPAKKPAPAAKQPVAA